MLAWILEQAGADPTYLIGGLPRWNRRGFRLGSGSAMVIEGDEYNTAFFDRGPKFLHYRPHLMLLGPVEFDHADLYRDLEAVLTAFRAGAALVPSHGALVVNAWSAGAIDACRDANAPIVTVGPDDGCDLRIIGHELDEHRSEAAAEWHGRPLRLDLPQPGLHNLQNGGLAVAAAAILGIEPADAATALRRFPGVARRMEVVGETGGLTVVDDFAHHPTALAVTIEAARQRWPERRLVVAFEPRSLTAASGSFQEAYLEALSLADLALVAPAFHRQRVADALDRQRLAADLEQRGVPCVLPAEDGDPAELLVAELRRGDVVVGCSSGDFGGFHQRVIELWTGGES
jgi:UDP-N-acetylmuramate: L-alanyl-gamma-D-glutamyl-meso-diaminopimelate ligase